MVKMEMVQFSFNPIDAVGGYSNFTITTLIESFGGASRESIDSIKFNAPKVFSAQKKRSLLKIIKL